MSFCGHSLVKQTNRTPTILLSGCIQLSDTEWEVLILLLALTRRKRNGFTSSNPS